MDRSLQEEYLRAGDLESESFWKGFGRRNFVREKGFQQKGVGPSFFHNWGHKSGAQYPIGHFLDPNRVDRPRR